MIRHGRYKYIHYVGLPPMLFDLEADPRERNDLGRDPAYQPVIAECEAELRKVVDPEAVDRLARADQAGEDRGARRARGDPQEGHVPLFAAAGGRGHVLLARDFQHRLGID